jgi:cytoskeletal protein CcmA (bactofilin family)
MLRPSSEASLPTYPSLDSARPATIIPGSRSSLSTAVSAGSQSTIAKGLTVVGDITGGDALESLFIDGRVEGSVNLPGARVTVGINGMVTASIEARDIVVLGKVRGNVTASNFVDIRTQGYVIGEATAPRVRIEDGAFFKGKLDIRKTELIAEPVVQMPAFALEPGMVLMAQPEYIQRQMQPFHQAN